MGYCYWLRIIVQKKKATEAYIFIKIKRCYSKGSYEIKPRLNFFCFFNFIFYIFL
jgi:hypothetical protein